VVAAGVLAACAGCGRNAAGTAAKDERAVLQARTARLQESLASSPKRTEPIARWLLPADLAEISGLALTPDGRLFTHNDETARITEIDYRQGTVAKYFFAGEKGLHGDFEGLTYVNNRFYLLSSNGIIYEFAEGAQEEHVDCTVHDTRLGKECEFEGLTYDPGTDAFVLACKNVGNGSKKSEELVLYRYRPAAQGAGETTRIAIPQDEVVGRNKWKQLRPTDITVDPSTGNYVLVSAQEKALVTISPDGAVVEASPLGGQHPQAEGVAITSDSILIVSDESTNQAATITLYRWR
jgi:uncharacterized protein YjiK